MSAGTVLITGASGFVGAPALAALQARGFRIHAVSRHPHTTTDGAITWHAADLLDPQQRRSLIDAIGPTHLLHLAWYVEHGKFWTAPENESWVGASLDLLKLFAENGGRRAVLTGSCAEYDWARGSELPFRETDPCRPQTRYGRAKLALMEQASALAANAGFSLAWARFFFMFGCGEDPRRLIPTMIRGLLAHQDVALSSGRQIRDFLDTRDIGAALAALLAAETVTGPVNVASGRAIALRDIGAMLTELSGMPGRLLQFGQLPDREGEPHSLVADIARLTDEVRFRPAASLEERLAQCLERHRAAMRHQ
ncbi:MAG TPA: NAD-dependent epimerase/dehydratase [Micropepsaceae bacterium]